MNDEIRINRRLLGGGSLRHLRICPSIIVQSDAVSNEGVLQATYKHSFVFFSHFSPLNSNSAFVFVASKFEISVSIASIGGSAAMALRNTCTRSHSSG